MARRGMGNWSHPGFLHEASLQGVPPLPRCRHKGEKAARFASGKTTQERETTTATTFSALILTIQTSGSACGEEELPSSPATTPASMGRRRTTLFCRCQIVASYSQ